MKLVRKFSPTLVPVCLALSAATFPAAAEVKLNGFASIVGGMTTDDNESYKGYTNDFEFDHESLFALQATADLGDNLTAVAQVIARGSQDWDPEFEWAYLSYDVTDNFNIKAGRLRAPFYYYSEFLDTAYTYHWIRPPVEMYDIDFTNFDGLSATYTFNTGDFEHRVMGVFGNRKNFIESFDVSDYRNMFGVNYDISFNEYSMKLVHITGKLSVDGGVFDSLDPAFSTLPSYFDAHFNVIDDTATYSAISFYADWGDFFAITEYSQIDFSKDYLLLQDDSRFYISGGYRMDEFTFHYTYATTKADDPESLVNDIPNIPETAPLLAIVNQVTSTNRDRNAHTFGVRYDFHPMAAFKAEWIMVENDGLSTEPNLLRVGVDLVF
jgi:hypothetical protein